MVYYIGQALGVCSTICCLILPLLQKKWQMLVMNTVINVFCALNLMMIGRGGLIICVYAVAIVQAMIALWHLQKDTAITKAENLVFLVLYVGCGALSVHSLLDVLPAVGALFCMLATFQKDVQKTRVLLLFNSGTFFAYYLLVGSTAVFSAVCTMATTVAAMWRHKKKQTA